MYIFLVGGCYFSDGPRALPGSILKHMMKTYTLHVFAAFEANAFLWTRFSKTVTDGTNIILVWCCRVWDWLQEFFPTERCRIQWICFLEIKEPLQHPIGIVRSNNIQWQLGTYEPSSCRCGQKLFNAFKMMRCGYFRKSVGHNMCPLC